MTSTGQPSRSSLPARMIRRWRWWGWGALAAMVALALAGAWLTWLSRQAPASLVQERQRLARLPAETLETEAVELEQRVLAALQPLEKRTELTITQQQANAWLHARLPLWLKHFSLDASNWWSREAGEPVISFGSNEATLAWAISGGASPRVMSAQFVLEGHEGKKVVRLVGASVGHLNLPGMGWLLRRAPRQEESGLGPVLALLDGTEIEGLILNDGQWTGWQPVRLVDVKVQEGVLKAVFESAGAITGGELPEASEERRLPGR